MELLLCSQDSVSAHKDPLTAYHDKNVTKMVEVNTDGIFEGFRAAGEQEDLEHRFLGQRIKA